MDPNHPICMNIEDIYGMFIYLMYGKIYTKYTNWDNYQRILINFLHDDDNTFIFKDRMLEEIKNTLYACYMLRCEIELMEERCLA